MSWPARLFEEAGRLLRTGKLGRSIVLLLATALLLLLVVNATTYVLIQRTAAFNDQVEATWQARRAGRSLLLNLKTAESAQRGYVLTGQPAFLMDYRRLTEGTPPMIDDLAQKLGDDPVGQASVEAVTRLSRDKLFEMSSVLSVSRAGRGQDAIDIIRMGQGTDLMSQLDAELSDLDRRMAARLSAGRAQSEGSARFTVVVNAIAGFLILVAGAIVFVLIRRYVADIKRAQVSLDRVNAGLEETVRNRTAALVRANEEVQRFAYIVSHDLRSPLVNVMGYTAELEQVGRTVDRAIVEAEKDRAVDPEVVSAVREDLPEALGFIRASTEKMDRLINAILKLSREGRRTLTPEPIAMADMVRRIADSVSHQVEAAAGQIEVAEMVDFESDRLSVEQIMGNLIDNAVKYLEPTRPGHIRVTGTDLPGGWVEYAVADNGRGIADRDHERIFELFRRSGRQDRPGEGLGLAFVRNSVRRLSGSMTVESVLGQGSTFRVKFPKRLILDEAGDTL